MLPSLPQLIEEPSHREKIALPGGIYNYGTIARVALEILNHFTIIIRPIKH